MKSSMVQYTKPDNHYVDLRLLFQNLVEKKWLILAISIVTCLSAMTYALFKPTNYQVSTLLKIEHKQHHILASLAQPSGLSSRLEEPLSVQIALIQSEFILRPVIKSLGLDISVTPYQRFFFSPIGATASSLVINELHLPYEYLKQPLRLIIDNNQQYRLYDQKGKLLIQANSGQLTANKEGIVAKLTTAMAPIHSEFTLIKQQESDVINKIHANLRITDLSGSAENHANKVAILRLSLTGQDPMLISNILNEIALTTQQLNIKLKASEAKKTLAFLNQQLPLVRLSLKEAEAKLNHYRSTSGRIDIKIQTQYLLTHLSDINTQVEKLSLKKISLMQQYTSNHPLVISLNQELKELEKKRDEIAKQLKNLPASDQEAVNLAREVNVKNNLYMTLLNQIHQLEVTKTGLGSDIQILSQATMPHVIQPIKLTMVGIFSAFIGLILGCLAVLSWRIYTQRIDDPRWTERTWNIKNLAIVPYSKEQSLNSFINKSQQHRSLPLLASTSPHDISMHALCSLRTYVQLNVKKSENNIIALMGVSRGIGKTFISANLAALLARLGHKVLLIDGDIGQGHSNPYFFSDNNVGLTDVISDIRLLEQALIPSQAFTSLSFLSAGNQPTHVADFLRDEKFKLLLLSLSKQYDYILINTSSNIFNADNMTIAALAGINLLVLGAHKHEAFDIEVVINNFNNAAIRIDGCVFNNTKAKRLKYYASKHHVVNEHNKVTAIRHHQH